MFVNSLQFGMTYEQFWYGDAKLYWAYQTAFINAKKQKFEEENNFAWLQGLYIYKAFNTVEYNINKKPSSPQEYYYEQPIDFSKTKNDMIKSEKQKLEDRMKSYLINQKSKLDKKGK